MSRILRRWIARLTGPFSRRRAETDLAAELESHLQMHADDFVRAGHAPAEARRLARARLGSVEGLREQHRELRGIPILQHLLQDTRIALRVMRRTPGFTLVTVLTLALGIGLNSAMFSIVHAVLLRPLPYEQPDQLMMIWATNERNRDREDVASYPDFEAWRSGSRSVESMAAFSARSGALDTGGGAEPVTGMQVSPGFFELLRVRPSLGRSLGPADGAVGAPPVALLSDAAWRTHFGARPEAIGRVVRINQVPHAIVGIMPPGFRFLPDRAEDVYVALPPDPSRSHGFLRVIGRLAPQASRESAQAELDAIAARIAADFPKTNANVGVNVVPLLDAVAAPARAGLLVLFGVVAMVLLIACTNILNLMLARNASRTQELAVRAALGAGRGRLLRQLITESLVLAGLGAVLGLVLARWGTGAFASSLAAQVPIPRVESVRTDAWVVLFTAGLALGAGLLCGVVPAFAASTSRLGAIPRESSRAIAGSASGRRTRAGLTILETALALVLLAAAGMLLETLLSLQNTAPGFDPARVAAAELRLPRTGMAPGPERAAFFADVRVRLAQVPGVESAGFVTNLPLAGGFDALQFYVGAQPTGKPVSANVNVASPGYFRTMSIRLAGGRDFRESDTAAAPPVAIVNETAARRFWTGEDPVGRQILLRGARGAAPHTIVGVVGDVRQSSLGSAPRPEIFLNSQQPGPDWSNVALVVRAADNPAALVPALKGVVAAASRDVVLARTATMRDVLALSLAEPRVYAIVLGAFAALALVLAAGGLYGVVSYSVSQRTQEFGIRMALGASAGEVTRAVLRQGAVYAGVGSAIGAAGAFAAADLLAALVPGAGAGRAGTLAIAGAMMIGVSLLASYLPARRAAHVDPIQALRAE